MTSNFYLLKHFLITLCVTVFTTDAMLQNPSPPLALMHIKRSSSELFKDIHESFKDKPIKQLSALLEQTDRFSCAYRAFFHAKCIDIALQRVRDGKSLNSSLEELLRNAGILNQVHERIKSFLNTKRPTFDQTIGLDVTHIPGICAEQLSHLNGNFLPLMLEDDGRTITVLHDSSANPDLPLSYTKKFVEECGRQQPFEKCKKIMDNSGELRYQLAKLDKAHSSAHFACRYPKHIFLASMVTDHNCKATLYVIDSNNNLIHEQPAMRTFVTKLLTYVEQHNNKNKRQKII